MSQRLPEHAELLFVRTTGTGTVHLFVRLPAWCTDPAPEGDAITGGAAFVALAATTTVTLCGQHTMPQAEHRHERVTSFADEDLCRACYRTLHLDDQPRAFEHPQPAAA